MEHAIPMSGQDFRAALSQMRRGLPVTSMIRVAEHASCAAMDADLELDTDEAAVCRDVEADARGLALAVSP